MAKDDKKSSDSPGAKTGNKTLATLILSGLIVVALIVGVFVLTGDSEPAEEPFVQQDVDLALDEGGCTPTQASQLETQADEESSAAEKGRLYQEAMDCYLQNNDLDSSLRVARQAEQAYLEAGLSEESKQMQRAIQAQERMQNFDPDEGGIGEDELAT